MRAPNRLVALALLVLVTSACGGEGSRAPSRTGMTGGSERDATDRHYKEIVDLGLKDLDAFWRQLFPRISTNPYRSPQAFHPYTPDAPPSIMCNVLNWSRNAFYCRSDQSISWDENWLKHGLAEFTTAQDMVPLAILSHEWGHHIANLARQNTEFTVRNELLADCYSGLYVDWADAGRGLVCLEPGDVREFLLTFFRVGNKNFKRSEWFARGLHGGARERTLAFAAGYISADPGFCAAYARYQGEPDVVLGSYTLTILPGTTTKSIDAPTVELGNPAFGMLTTQLRWLPSLTAQPAVTQLPEVAKGWFGSSQVRTIGEPEEFGGLGTGSAANVRYEQTYSDTTGTHVIHGALFLHVREQGGGILFDVFDEGAAPSDEGGWQLLGDYLFTQVYGLNIG
jgi:predicted metalloprotease